jgi:hypothetical protein
MSPTQHQFQRTGGSIKPNGREDIAMLLFYLRIIIFEAMLEANMNKRKAHESTVIE